MNFVSKFLWNLKRKRVLKRQYKYLLINKKLIGKVFAGTTLCTDKYDMYSRIDYDDANKIIMEYFDKSIRIEYDLSVYRTLLYHLYYSSRKDLNSLFLKYSWANFEDPKNIFFFRHCLISILMFFHSENLKINISEKESYYYNSLTEEERIIEICLLRDSIFSSGRWQNACEFLCYFKDFENKKRIFKEKEEYYYNEIIKIIYKMRRYNFTHRFVYSVNKDYEYLSYDIKFTSLCQLLYLEIYKNNKIWCNFTNGYVIQNGLTSGVVI